MIIVQSTIALLQLLLTIPQFLEAILPHWAIQPLLIRLKDGDASLPAAGKLRWYIGSWHFT